MKSMRQLVARVSRAAKGYGSVTTAMIALFIAVLAVLNVVIYALATKYSWYAYTTTTYEHEIGASSEVYFSDLSTEGKTVKIRFCMQKDELEADTVFNLVHQSALQYAAKYSFIEVDYINIYTDPDEVTGYKYETDSETGVRKKINDINTETVIIDGDGQFMVQQMSSFFILDSSQSIQAYNGEEVMSSMVHWVLTDEHKSVYFTRNHGETSNLSFYNLLVCAGYTVHELDLSTSEVPPDGDLVVISNPLYDFESAAPGSGIISEIERLGSFLERGGMLYVTLDPLVTGLSHLDALLAEWGLTRQAATVRDSSQALTADGLTLITRYPDSSIAKTISERIAPFDSGSVVLKSAAPIILTASANGAATEAVLSSSPSAKAYASGELVSSDGNYTVAALSTSASGGSIFLVSSIYLSAQDAIQSNSYANGDLLYALFEAAGGASVPLGTSILVYDSEQLQGLAMGTVHLYTVLLVVLIPALAVIVGAVIRIRRKNR